MNRRALLKGLLTGGGVVASGFRLPLVHAADYRGKLFVFVQADGGWDPTSFCDPKSNTPGEPVINHWAERDEVRQIGRIRYAPFARNERFFRKYHRRMLVINGVDAQTNSHTVGIVHNWSGRNSEGYPTTTALLAAHYAADLSVPYLSFGGFSATAGLTRFTRIDNADLLHDIAYPKTKVFRIEDWEALESSRAASAERLVAAPNLLPGDVRNRSFYRSALATEGLKAYADAIPPEFDTHANHDPDHEWPLGNLTDSVDFLWEYAEEHGLADRMVVVMGSDFGRTNFYNAQSGKDHWPIGSYVVMEKDQPWTGRAVGETDGLHFAQRVNPRTLRRDDRNGTIIYPKHVHKALRRYLGIANTPGAQRFPFNNTEDFAFFG